MKRIYLFNIVAWNYRKKIGFPVCKNENFAGLKAHRKRGKSARASPTPHHTLNEERSARFTAQPLSALASTLPANVKKILNWKKEENWGEAKGERDDTFFLLSLSPFFLILPLGLATTTTTTTTTFGTGAKFFKLKACIRLLKRLNKRVELNKIHYYFITCESFAGWINYDKKLALSTFYII